jgi:hypothetical protein
MPPSSLRNLCNLRISVPLLPSFPFVQPIPTESDHWRQVSQKVNGSVSQTPNRPMGIGNQPARNAATDGANDTDARICETNPLNARGERGEGSRCDYRFLLNEPMRQIGSLFFAPLRLCVRHPVLPGNNIGIRVTRPSNVIRKLQNEAIARRERTKGERVMGRKGAMEPGAMCVFTKRTHLIGLEISGFQLTDCSGTAVTDRATANLWNEAISDSCPWCAFVVHPPEFAKRSHALGKLRNEPNLL